MRQALLAPGAADVSGGLQEMRQALLGPGTVDASGGLQEMCQALLAPGASVAVAIVSDVLEVYCSVGNIASHTMPKTTPKTTTPPRA